ncbi:hypothetical protein HanPSC8_Chr08g0348511 [Helianthus annuus]|nr:hypothetical protein HanPSC8_Chr08g0348511 [Helianthus annuus]
MLQRKLVGFTDVVGSTFLTQTKPNKSHLHHNPNQKFKPHEKLLIWMARD